MASKILILPFMLILFSCFKTKAKEEITFKSCSGSVVLDLSSKYYNAYKLTEGPEGHLTIEIYNDTEQDTIYYPKISRGDCSSEVDSRFELVFNQDTILMCATTSLKMERRNGKICDVVLLFDEIEESSKPNYIADSSFYMGKMANYLRNGELIFRDLKNNKIVHIPKSPDFKIQSQVIPFD